ncbi:YjcG family protein [Guptibacillus algicola]|uniref:YjcG family protein n=1 Tax=Guptibacillus algicola TaxID=225844 RepID=UPI001CD1D29E|nr:YjcG family protein [Alkalihalobacillus algicola]MCA0987869.1 YjcG family protein [Alkalihalobacillus algicola]
MKYGIAIFPSKKLQDIANSYRKRYDPHYALIPPHLTIREAFEATQEEIDKITPELHRISDESKPFTMNVYKIGSFHPVNNVIYMKVKENEVLDDLYRQLNPEEVRSDRDYKFVPHITIAQKLSDDEHSDVYGSLRMMDVDEEEKIDRFQLLYQLENGSWTVYETFHLGKVR